jgi:hypothetical protein
VLGTDPPAESGLDAAALQALASDAAQRAWELAIGDEAAREALSSAVVDSLDHPPAPD